MEKDFQTSFIPKKPIVQERAVSARSVGLLTVIAIFILFTVLLASAGLYFYKGVMIKSKISMEGDLIKAKNRFEPGAIKRYQTLDKRLRAANDVLSGHINITPVFQSLQSITMKTVRYTDFSYDITNNKEVIIKLKGLAAGYAPVALQSDLFAQNENFINPVFTNLVLNDQGSVAFDLEFSVDAGFVNYKQTLETES